MLILKSFIGFILVFSLACNPFVKKKDKSQNPSVSPSAPINPSDPNNTTEDPPKNPAGNPKENSTENLPEKPPKEPPKTEEKQKVHNVIVIDDGFELSHEVFSGKIIAQYTIDCEDAEEEGDSWLNLPYDEYKKKVLANLQQNDDSCTLIDGSPIELNPAIKLGKSMRTDWNEAVLDKTHDQFIQGMTSQQRALFSNILTGSEGKYSQHGTKTASVIAYDNPYVNLVTIQIELSHPSEFEESKWCLNQDQIDKSVRLLKDPDYIEAYLKTPPSSVDLKLAKILKDNNIKMVNMSFGSPPRQVLENKYEENGCGVVNMREYFKLENELEKKLGKKHEEYLKKEGLYHESLALTSAGNNGVQIDTIDDARSCSDPENLGIVIGSYDFSTTNESSISAFSQRGKCVDAYMLGDNVVTVAPGGFLFPASGTSFSSPLALRYLTKTFSAELNPKELMGKFLGSLNKRKFLPKDSYPEEIAFESPKKLDRFSLTSAAKPLSKMNLLQRKRILKALRILR